MRDPIDNAVVVIERCGRLARSTEEPGRATRRFATPALREPGETVSTSVGAAGLAVRRDAIGNVIGRLEGSGARTLLIGHLDTVRAASRYDGILGALVGNVTREDVVEAIDATTRFLELVP